MNRRKTKATGAEGWRTESLEPHFHNFERFGPRGVEEIDSWLPERPFWALNSWIHNSCAFAFRYPLLSTNNLAGAVTSPSVAQTDLTLPTACDGDTVLIPLSRMWQPRLRDGRVTPQVSWDPSVSTRRDNRVLYDAISCALCPASSRSYFLPSPPLFPSSYKTHCDTSHKQPRIQINCNQLYFSPDVKRLVKENALVSNTLFWH